MIIKFKIVIILTLLHYKCFSQNNINNYKDIDKKRIKNYFREYFRQISLQLFEKFK